MEDESKGTLFISEPRKLMTQKEVQEYIDNYMATHKSKADLDFVKMQALNQEALAAQALSEAKKIASQVEINKVEELRLLLQAHVVDQEKTVLGSDPAYKPMISGAARNTISQKLIDIIERF